MLMRARCEPASVALFGDNDALLEVAKECHLEVNDLFSAVSMIAGGLSALSGERHCAQTGAQKQTPAQKTIEKVQKKIEKKIEPPEIFEMGEVAIDPELDR